MILNIEHKCKFCGNPAMYRIWEGYFGYSYYCKLCADKQTMDGK